MYALKFFKIDWIRVRSQSKFILLFSTIMILISIKLDNPIWTLGYFCFFSVIFSATPFGVQTMSNSGFLNMLPASSFSRVAGRYCFAITMTVMGLLFGELSVVIYYLTNHTVPENIIPISIIIFSLALITNSVQYILFYAVGNIESKQLMSVLQLMPGFAMFFGSSILLDYIMEHPNNGLELLSWAMTHMYVIAFILLITSVLILYIGMLLSNKIVYNKDMQ